MDGIFIIAVHALVYLGHVEDYVSSEQLAKNICANPARIRKVMSQLRNKGFIETKEGKLGGYKISKDPRTITLKDIASALNSSFAKPTWKSEDFDKNCLISTHMKDIMDSLGQEMDKILYKFLEQISIKEIENKILRKDWSNEATAQRKEVKNETKQRSTDFEGKK